MPREEEDLIRLLAEQTYRYHLLVKTLREHKYLKAGEPESGWSDKEFQEFLKDFRGAYFPGSLPSHSGS